MGDTQRHDLQTKFAAQQLEVLGLVVPRAVQPLAPEYQRLSADLDRGIGGVAKLAQAEENDQRQDLTLVHQTTGWDARLAASRASRGPTDRHDRLGQDALYALFRLGLPTDPSAAGAGLARHVRNGLVKAGGGRHRPHERGPGRRCAALISSLCDEDASHIGGHRRCPSFGDLVKATLPRCQAIGI
jgi:hypothetical protein